MPTALIVDDDISTREILSHYLRKMGFESILCVEGSTALSAMRTAQVHIVVCDLEMPGMNGLEFLAVLRAAGNKTPVIALSGHPLMLEKAMLAGAQTAITKPIRYATLEPVVRLLCPTASS